MSRIKCLLMATLLMMPAGVFAQAYRPLVGQQHPPIMLPNIQNGKPVSLDDFRGSKVILIHFASW